MLWYVGVLYDGLRGRIAIALEHDDEKDLGASALEWAIIAAISVIMATVIGAVIYNLVKDKSTQIKNCNLQDPSQNCDPNGGS